MHSKTSTAILHCGGLSAEINLLNGKPDSFCIRNTTNGQTLLHCPGAELLCPVVNEKRVRLSFQSMKQENNGFILQFVPVPEDSTGISAFCLRIDCSGSALTMRSEFSMSDARPAELNALDILPPDAHIGFYDLINFRNHHGTESTWPETCLADHDVHVSTFSDDWQFAPHPTMLLFRKHETVLLAAALELPHGFGFRFDCDRYFLQKWQLDYGPAGHGEPLTPGQHWCSPSIVLIKSTEPVSVTQSSENVYHAIDAYCDLLAELGHIPHPEERSKYAWHRNNLYCTWMDEGYIFNKKYDIHELMTFELNDQITNKKIVTHDVLDEKLVRDSIEIIERERLPLRTILIDSGWQKALGQWEADTDKFPDFRGLIDNLHAKGYKVILWINFADIDPAAQVDEAFLCPGYKNKFGKRFWNYSDSKVQQEYLRPLMHRLISSDPGCYNADGIKTDFLADKIHPETPCTPEWRGEENYLVHLLGEVVRTMRSIKPESCHIGCAGHPYLAQYMDIIRTYDIFTPNPYEHLARGKMAYHCAARVPISFDFHNYTENFPEYFQVAAENDCSVEVGNVQGQMKDFFSSWSESDENFFQIIRDGLGLFENKL